MGVSVAGLTLIAAGGYLTGKGPAGSLKPGAPKLPTPPAMPDQTVIDQGNKLAAQSALARSGRASTLLSSGTDTGGGERLGP